MIPDTDVVPEHPPEALMGELADFIPRDPRHVNTAWIKTLTPDARYL